MTANVITDIIDALPPLKGDRDVIVPGQQSVKDIEREVLDSHQVFASDYDRIAAFFVMDADPLRSLFQFCKNNLPYKAEDEIDQTSRSPIAILMLADTWGNDCKHYSSLIGGVIDACNRAGYSNYDWCYRFASYNIMNSTKEHVFVVINPGAEEIWLDPAPVDNMDGTFTKRSFNDRKAIPYYITDKKPTMSLNRISGCSVNPNYQGQAMGYIWAWPAEGTYWNAGEWVSPFDEITTPIINPSAPVSADPAVPTYDPNELNRLENVNDPYIADYPTVTGDPIKTLPTLTTADSTGSTGLTTGFDITTFIKTNPVETILIGGAIVIGGIYLFKRNKKKRTQRAK
jgi:hypothetical protein